MKHLLTLLLLFPLAATATEPTQAPPTELPAIEVRAEYVDPFAFRNPIDYQSTPFDRHWKDPVSMESFGMDGGVVPWAVKKINEAMAKAARKGGWKQQIQHANARPSPLTPEQLDRAAGRESVD